jgi:hypothetical protein
MDLRVLFVVLYLLAAALPIAGVWIAVVQARRRLAVRRATPPTIGEFTRMVSEEPIRAELRGLLLSGCLVSIGVAFGTVASVWSLLAL